VGIGTTTPNPSAALDIKSDTAGILIPRLTTEQVNAINNPASGLVVFNKSLNQFVVFKNNGWKTLTPMPKGGMILDAGFVGNGEGPNLNEILKEGFKQIGYYDQAYTSSIVSDSSIEPFIWYKGNLSNGRSPSINPLNGTGLTDTDFQGSIAAYNTIDSLLYVFMSFQKPLSPYNLSTVIFTYQQDSDTWKRIQTNGLYEYTTNTKYDTIINHAVFDGSIVFTGSQFIFWGGKQYGTSYRRTGARYNPVTNVWDTTSLTGAPAARAYHKAIWNGSKMIIWGGRIDAGLATNTCFNNGGVYDPVTNTWGGMPSVPSSTFQGREHFSMASAGNKILIWGGSWQQRKTRTIANPCIGNALCTSPPATVSVSYDSANLFNNGIVFDLSNNSYVLMPVTTGPGARHKVFSEVIGNDLYIVGGSSVTAPQFNCSYTVGSGCNTQIVKSNDSALASGYKYNFNTNSWTVLPNSPVAFYNTRPVWDGSRYLHYVSLPNIQSFDITTGQWSPANIYPPLNNGETNANQTQQVWKTGSYDAATGISSMLYFSATDEGYCIGSTPTPFQYRSTPAAITKRLFLYQKK